MERCKIYVVDDDEAVRSSLAFLLHAKGFSHTIYSRGDDFLIDLDALDPGCVLLDVRMAGVSGLQVLAELRMTRPGWPVIMMTGHGDQRVARRAIGGGAFAFIGKPLDGEELVAILDRGCRLLADSMQPG